MQKGPHILLMSANTSECKDHSVELLVVLDAVSISTLVEQGIWQALSQISLSLHHCQICLAKSLQSADLIPPMALTYAAVVVLSDCNQMCLLPVLAHRDCKLRRTAFSSK